MIFIAMKIVFHCTISTSNNGRTESIHPFICLNVAFGSTHLAFCVSVFAWSVVTRWLFVKKEGVHFHTPSNLF